MSQGKNNAFAILFISIAVIIGIAIITMFLPKKKTSESSGFNMDKVEILNKDSEGMNTNLKKQADSEIGKVEVKDRINVDMSKLYENDQQVEKIQEVEETNQEEVKTQVKTTSRKTTVKTESIIKKVTDEKIVDPTSPEQVTTIAATPKTRSGFNDTKNQQSTISESNSKSSSIINVSVFDKQQVKNGSSLRMISTEDFYLEGTKIPKNTFITGIVSMSNQRVNVSIPSILYNGKLFNTNFTVYDAGDGLQGINVPDLVVHDIAQEEANNALSEVKVHTPIVTVPINTSRKALHDNSAFITDKYRLILKSK